MADPYRDDPNRPIDPRRPAVVDRDTTIVRDNSGAGMIASIVIAFIIVGGAFAFYHYNGTQSVAMNNAPVATDSTTKAPTSLAPPSAAVPPAPPAPANNAPAR